MLRRCWRKCTGDAVFALMDGVGTAMGYTEMTGIPLLNNVLIMIAALILNMLLWLLCSVDFNKKIVFAFNSV